MKLSCRTCGAVLAADQARCSHCGAEATWLLRVGPCRAAATPAARELAKLDATLEPVATARRIRDAAEALEVAAPFLAVEAAAGRLRDLRAPAEIALDGPPEPPSPMRQWRWLWMPVALFAVAFPLQVVYIARAGNPNPEIRAIEEARERAQLTPPPAPKAPAPPDDTVYSALKTELPTPDRSCALAARRTFGVTATVWAACPGCNKGNGAPLFEGYISPDQRTAPLVSPTGAIYYEWATDDGAAGRASDWCDGSIPVPPYQSVGATGDEAPETSNQEYCWIVAPPRLAVTIRATVTPGGGRPPVTWSGTIVGNESRSERLPRGPIAYIWSAAGQAGSRSGYCSRALRVPDEEDYEAGHYEMMRY